ncbi:hypothetical protein B0T19DRAFT_411316 [Cercophora scortea]|uniref:Uncharacterized protein n=1 Tax=Cercophora scortea TaxID=314031 RepID=A0AAE0J5Q1_9PEZI|nr:hypothetical protein B0T19DRAFT_411316 [Cercophora scortea]
MGIASHWVRLCPIGRRFFFLAFFFFLSFWSFGPCPHPVLRVTMTVGGFGEMRDDGWDMIRVRDPGWGWWWERERERRASEAE